MNSKDYNRRQFIKIAAGSALVMLGNGSVTRCEKEVVSKSHRHYKVFSKGKIGKLQIKNCLIKAATETSKQLAL